MSIQCTTSIYFIKCLHFSLIFIIFESLKMSLRASHDFCVQRAFAPLFN